MVYLIDMERYTRNPFKRVTVSKSRPMDAAYPASVNLYQPCIVDKFTQEVDESDGSVCLTSAVSILLNQKRLDRMSEAAILQEISEQAQVSDSLAALRSKCTDEQLISLVKSRYIQSASELLSWSEHIESLFPENKPAADQESAPDSEPAPVPVE